MSEEMKTEVAEAVSKAITDLNAISNGKNERVVPSAIMIIAILERIVDKRLGVLHLDSFLNIDRGLPVKGQSINLDKKDMVILLDEVFPSKSITSEFFDAINYLDEIKQLEQKNTISIELNKYDGELLYTSIIREMNLPEYIFASSSVSELASIILDTKEGESFYDFASGVGLSTACITRGKDNLDITLIEKVSYFTALTECMAFLCNKTNLKTGAGEGFAYEERKYDKIFVDPPLKARLGFNTHFLGIESDDSTLAAVLKTVSVMSENGRAVVMIPGSFLFSTQKAYKEARKYLVDNSLIKGVILLPSMWKATSIKTVMLVLERNSNTSAMINIASDEDAKIYTSYNKLDRTRSLSKEAISFIKERLNGEFSPDNHATLVTKEMIQEQSYSLEPTHYITQKEQISRDLSTINADIDSTISEINALLDSLRLKGGSKQ